MKIRSISNIIVGLVFALFSALSFASPVDINSADAKTIAAAISGIGLKKAEAIVAYRNEKGPFQSIDELTNIKGIGTKTLEKNKDNISLQGVN
ncbi:MAG: helix-hairpin-helix domain-containing protein [Gammaproteobacteria bacterium]|nr:helix-hairpin-helix domain-containing protein [Gammaproteobacteria bacterium]